MEQTCAKRIGGKFDESLLDDDFWEEVSTAVNNREKRTSLQFPTDPQRQSQELRTSASEANRNHGYQASEADVDDFLAAIRKFGEYEEGTMKMKTMTKMKLEFTEELAKQRREFARELDKMEKQRREFSKEMENRILKLEKRRGEFGEEIENGSVMKMKRQRNGEFDGKLKKQKQS